MKKLKDVSPLYHNILEEKPAKGDETDFKFIVPSGQFWGDLTPEEKKVIYNIAKQEGVNLDNLLYKMKQMLPRTPRGY